MGERFTLIPQKEALKQQNEKGGAQTAVKPDKYNVDPDNKNIKTATNPGLRENSADLGEKITRFTAPVQVLLAVGLAPFSGGLSAAFGAGAFYDVVQKDYATDEKNAAKNKRLLDEAQGNGHEIEVVGKKDTAVGTSNTTLNEDSGNPVPPKEVPLKPGYVEIIGHDPETKKTKVKVLYEAAPHEATVIAKKEQEKYALAA